MRVAARPRPTRNRRSSTVARRAGSGAVSAVGSRASSRGGRPYPASSRATSSGRSSSTRGARAAAVRPLRRRRRLHARRPRQRPPPDRIRQVDAPGLHHCSWDVPSIQDDRPRRMQWPTRATRKGWGLGRHVLGSNYFHYVRDPWGSYCRVLLRHRLHPGRDGLAGGSPCPREQPLLLGPGAAEGLRHQLRIPGMEQRQRRRPDPPGGPVSAPAHPRKTKIRRPRIGTRVGWNAGKTSPA